MAPAEIRLSHSKRYQFTAFRVQSHLLRSIPVTEFASNLKIQNSLSEPMTLRFAGTFGVVRDLGQEQGGRKEGSSSSFVPFGRLKLASYY